MAQRRRNKRIEIVLKDGTVSLFMLVVGAGICRTQVDYLHTLDAMLAFSPVTPDSSHLACTQCPLSSRGINVFESRSGSPRARLAPMSIMPDFPTCSEIHCTTDPPTEKDHTYTSKALASSSFVPMPVVGLVLQIIMKTDTCMD